MININNLKNKIILSHLIQIAIAIFVGICFYAYQGVGFVSGILGGIVCVVPSIVFAVVFFKALFNKTFSTNSSKQLLANFYLAELIKFGATGLMFFLCIFFVQLNPIPFFVAFILVQITNWVLNFINFRGVGA